jgi:DNA-binding CsgD family transcriptional regulator
MGKSSALRARDVRAVYELAGACRDLGDDPGGWWRHYGQQLAALAGADFAGCGQVAGVATGRAETLGIGEWGWENGFDRGAWVRSAEAFEANPEYSAQYRTYFRRLAADDGVCLARSDLMPDREWLRSWMFRRISEPMGTDHYLWCYRSLPRAAGQHGVVVLCRARGRPDFAARDKAVVRAAQALVGPLVGGPLAGFGEPSPAALAPRARRVLRLLLEGAGDKQVAKALGISPHTVNQYVKLIFEHFRVGSRAELLARWVRRGWTNRAAWAETPNPSPGAG